MSKKIKYSDNNLGEIKVIPDFLPSPEELAFRDDSVKVTISLSQSSVDFFKREAKKQNTPNNNTSAIWNQISKETNATKYAN